MPKKNTKSTTRKHRLSENNFLTFITLVVISAISIFAISFYRYMPKLSQAPGAAAQVSTGRCQAREVGRVCWYGKDYYLHGANFPWNRYGEDFSSTTGSIKNNIGTLDGQLKVFRDNNLPNVRFWAFEDGEQRYMIKNAQGLPERLNDDIYKDFDALLNLASKHDLYLHITLFNHLYDAPPDSWVDTQEKRNKLVAILTPLFSRYARHPNLMSWDLYNEPEHKDFPGNQNRARYYLDLFKQLAEVINTETHAYVHIGGGLSTNKLYNDSSIPLTMYQAHEYVHWGGWPATAGKQVWKTPFTELTRLYGINKPIVVGEIDIEEDSKTTRGLYNFCDRSKPPAETCTPGQQCDWCTTEQRNTVFSYTGELDGYNQLVTLFNNKYAGVWPWSVHHTDGFKIDYGDMSRFARYLTDNNLAVIGPRAVDRGPNPSVSPSPFPPPSNPPSTSSPNSSINGSIQAVPGKIEAENFNNTGNNVGYFDTTTANEGGVGVLNTSVDIQHTNDTAGGFFNVGWTRASEWLTYRFNATESGEYVISTRVANVSTGGRFEIIIDGISLGEMQAPNTSNWQSYQNVNSKQFSLSAGAHNMRVNMKTNALNGAVGNYNYYEFRKVATPSSPSISSSPSSSVAPSSNIGSIIEVYASGKSAYGVPPEILVSELVNGTYSKIKHFIVDAIDSNGQFGIYRYQHSIKVNPTNLRIYFVNDYCMWGEWSPGVFSCFNNQDRNVRIHKVVVDGLSRETTAANVYSTGAWDSVSGCGPGFKQSNLLSCSGYFEYR